MRRSVLALTLAASTLTAVPSGFFQPFWTCLSSLWGEASAKEGPGAAPDGRTFTVPSTAAGPGADPNGRTFTAPPKTNEGPGWDPNGDH
jgi:hypothetical protein